ncbi:MAG: Na+/H+ antiporter NhaC family protein, partial [Cyanobacteria bacterium J06560_2]
MEKPHPPTSLIVVLTLSFILLVSSATQGIFIAYPLLIALGLLVAVLHNRGFALSHLLKMGLAGARQSLPVVQVLLLIGAVTAVWIAAGTVPALVYYGTKWISGQFFLLWAFLLTSGVSMLLGTSFGTVGTIGIALMVIARSNGLAVNPVAGAIIAGAFLGDRCSPMSSSAHLVASITHTHLYTNLKNMVASSRWPFAISVVFYLSLSLFHPVQLAESPVTAKLPDFFDLSPMVLLPAIAILLLAILRVNVKLAMLVSIGIGGAIAHTLQHTSLTTLFTFILFGYQPSTPTPFQEILLGGGLLPMIKATVVVLISTAFAGIFSGSHALSFLGKWLSHLHTRKQLAQATILISILANAFGCTQTIAIVLTGQIMQPYYRSHPQQLPNLSSNEQLALTLEDTAVVIAPLLPWNIAGLIPATMLTVGPGFIPYAIYLLLLPLFTLFRQPHKADLEGKQQV